MATDHRSLPPKVIDEASEWFVSMRDSALTPADRQAFAAWLRLSPVHLRAYLDMAVLWGDAADVSAGIEVHEASDNVSMLRPHAEVPSTALTGPSPGRYRRHRSYLELLAPRVAAGLLLIACSLGIGVWWYGARVHTYGTDVGEQRVISLDDGSSVQMDARSIITVRFLPWRRDVDLVAGQALFKVAHDASRPFTVSSDKMKVLAVGTQFDVNRMTAGTSVSVLEGRVGVSLRRVRWSQRLSDALFNSNGHLEGRILEVGQQLDVRQDGTFEDRPNANVIQATGWLRHEFVFENDALDQVIEIFNRYSRTPIRIADPSLGSMHINAVFHTNSPDSLLRFVGRLDRVTIDRSPNDITIERHP